LLTTIGVIVDDDGATGSPFRGRSGTASLPTAIALGETVGPTSGTAVRLESDQISQVAPDNGQEAGNDPGAGHQFGRE
jgi:hypothetical protein